MECPECHYTNPEGHHFCGACGHTLIGENARDHAPSSAPEKFCGQCGSSLATTGDITLARSGLITRVNRNALDILGYEQSEMQGKPFSIFVEHADLVIFFSHLNELQSSAKKQSLEIRLKHKENKGVYVKLECNMDKISSAPDDPIHIFLTDITAKHQAAEQMQTQQDLLGLIFAITNNISNVSTEHLDQSIEDALKKICLFTKADRGFIYRMNRPAFRLDPLYEWRQPVASLEGVKVKPRAVSLSKLKHIMLRLRQEKKIVVADTATLEPEVREELRHWHHIDMKAIICHIIYSEKEPMGVIGVARQTSHEEWEPHCDELVKFFGGFVSSRLHVPADTPKTADKPQTVAAWPGKQRLKFRSDTPVDNVDISDIDPGLDEEMKRMTPPLEIEVEPEADPIPISPVASQSMRLEKIADDNNHGENKQSVFPRGDGLVLLTCPHCGIQEPVSVDQFDQLGNAVRVTCPCKNRFNVMLEKRRFFRKTVRLDGYFSLSQESESNEASNTTWGPMVVTDISKTGLQFTSRKANLIHLGDLLMVRFNLDNENQSLIHKPARVISVSGQEVGCQFEGADNYDITLGFYFM